MGKLFSGEFRVNWYPEKRSIAIALLWATIVGMASLLSLPDWIWKLTGGLLAATAMLDWWRTRRTPTPLVRRRTPHNFPVSTETEVKLEILNKSNTVQRLRIHDHHPAHFYVKSMPQEIKIAPETGLELSYYVTPPTRGDAVFSQVEIQLFSRFRLWRHKRLIPIRQTVRVYPNYSGISSYTLLATHNHLSQIGIKKRQRRGEGSEFLQLREYQQGDSRKNIHWQASARLRKLISKDYEEEKDQQLIFLLDCGRHMRHRDESNAHLDQALNAMLLVSYVAVRQGDAVGVLTLGGHELWLSPRKGPDTVNRMLGAIYGLNATTQPADYLRSVGNLSRFQQRRALIVVVTNTRDEDHNDLRLALCQLRKRHLVVLADLRESVLDRALTEEISNTDDALRYHAVADYLASRKRNHKILRHRGILTLDITPRQLPIALTNQYLAIKRSATL